MKSSKKVYEKFVDFCTISLKGENPKFLELIKSRYEGCDDEFRTSNHMAWLLERTQKNMSDEESRKFVHLKDLLTVLKIKASAKRKKKMKKRKHSIDLEAETEHAEKIPKLKDCRVVMDKFPHFNASLIDLNISTVESDDSSKLYPRRSCSIADGNFNSAPCIAIANDCCKMENLNKDLGSGFGCHIVSTLSPTLNLDSSSSGKGHSSKKSAFTINHSNINESAESCNLNTLNSTISRESTTPALSENGPEKLSFQKPLVAPQSSEQSYISACASAIITSLECETTPEQSNYECLNYDQKSLEKQDVSTLDLRSSVYKLPKKVPFIKLSSAKTDAYTSSSLFDVKPYSLGIQQKATQEPKSLTGGKARLSSMETKTLEPEAPAGDDMEHSTGVDKLRQKLVIKLERLLTAAPEPRSLKPGGKAKLSSMESETLEPGASAGEDKEHSTGVDKLRQKLVIKLERLLTVS